MEAGWAAGRGVFALEGEGALRGASLDLGVEGRLVAMAGQNYLAALVRCSSFSPAAHT